jgi:MFS family permease
MPSPSSKLLLPVIVFSQFAGTSLWFAGNAIINDIQQHAGINVANITSIVQIGFIIGTLVFSILTIADRYPARKVFFFSCLVAATANLMIIFIAGDITWLFVLRFITGFFLAGIYPVGMKIAADCFPGKLGNALGFLVGALVLGTAFPHIVKSQLELFRWEDVILFTSILAFTGGLLILFLVPANGIHTNSRRIKFNTAFTVFNNKNFQSAAFGYFGHMWELYAYWAFVPIMIAMYNEHYQTSLNISFWSFAIIASGALGCVAGGLLSKNTGSKQVAFYSLLVSGICCLLSPLFFSLPVNIFLLVMLVWGFTVVADSPQFSTLVAQSAPLQNKGTALTIVTSIGFAITIVSIQLLKPMAEYLGEKGFVILFIGPVFGLMALRKYKEGNF